MESPSKYRPTDGEITQMVDESTSRNPEYTQMPMYGNLMDYTTLDKWYRSPTAARWPGKEIEPWEHCDSIKYATPEEVAAEPPIIVD